MLASIGLWVNTFSSVSFQIAYVGVLYKKGFIHLEVGIAMAFHIMNIQKWAHFLEQTFY